VLLAALSAGCTLAPAPADAKPRCRSGFKLVGKRCKRVRKHTPSTSNAIAAKTFSGAVGSSTISLSPNAKAKTGSAVIRVSCTSAEGVSVSEANGPSGETVKLYPVVLLQQTFTGSFSDPRTGEAMSWTLTGLWKTATRFEGIFSGTATSSGVNGFGGPGCSVPQTNLVLR
jgi:hypothetical protein